MATLCVETCCNGAVKVGPSTYNFDDLLNAIAVVESRNDPNAVGDGGKAIGAYQIHRIYVDDVNSILGWRFFSYKDRWSAAKSREMVGVYLRHYGKGKSLEAMARIHNGGPKGDKKKSTLDYLEKIKKELTRFE